MTKLNTKILLVFLRKVFLSNHSILKKKFWRQIGFTKVFIFDIFTSFQNLCLGFDIWYPCRLQFYVVTCSSIIQFCFVCEFIGILFYTFNLKTSLTILFARKLRRSALEFARCVICKSFINNTSLKIFQRFKEKLDNIRDKT